jgi:hypothetical protein
MVHFKVAIRPNDPASVDTQTSRQTNNMANLILYHYIQFPGLAHHQTGQTLLQGRLAIHQIVIQMLANSLILSTTAWLPLAEKKSRGDKRHHLMLKCYYNL